MNYFKKGLSLLNIKHACVLWISCIEKERNISEVTRLWGMDPSSKALYKYPEKLEELDMMEIKYKKIDTGKGKRVGKICYSKFDWLAKYIFHLAKNYKESPFVASINEIFNIFNTDENDVLNFLESDAFRKGCMSLDFLLEEIKFTKAAHAALVYVNKKLEKAENPDYRVTFIGDLSIPIEIPEEIKEMGIDEKIKEIFKNAKKEPWKHKFLWQQIIFGRLQLLSLLRAFEEDIRCFNYWKSGHVHIPPIISVGVMPVDRVYNLIKDEKYEISEKIKPLFDMKKLAKEEISSLKYIKNEWPDVWKEIKKELNIKENVN